MLLKGNFAWRLWPIDAVVGADWRRRGSDSFGIDRGFNPATNQPIFGGELAQIVGRSGHDRSTIEPRSWATIVVKLQSMASDEVGRSVALIPRCRGPWSRLIVATIARRLGHDRVEGGQWSRRNRTTIASRSDHDCIAIRSCFPPSDEDRDLMEIGRSRELHASPRWDEDRSASWPSDEDRAIVHCLRSRKIAAVRWRSGRLDGPNRAIKPRPYFARPMEIGRSQCVHASTGKPSIEFHLLLILARVLLMIAWTWVHAISAVLTASDARHASMSPAKGKTCVGHSPTRKRYIKIVSINIGAW